MKVTTTILLQTGGVCNFNTPLGNVEAVSPAPGSPVAGPVRLEFGDTQITASTAITVDSTSIVYTGYTNSSGNFMGAVRNFVLHLINYHKYVNTVIIFQIQFYITATSFLLVPGSSFYTRMISSPVKQLQWESGLDYIYVATESSVSVWHRYFYIALLMHNCIDYMINRFSKFLWRNVLTSLIVRAASVTTTHCVAGVL